MVLGQTSTHRVGGVGGKRERNRETRRETEKVETGQRQEMKDRGDRTRQGQTEQRETGTDRDRKVNKEEVNMETETERKRKGEKEGDITEGPLQSSTPISGLTE